MDKKIKSTFNEQPEYNVRSRNMGLIDMVMMVIFDQLTKQWAVNVLKDSDNIAIIPNVFELQYLENRGAAFGMLQGQRIFFLILTVVVVLAILYLYWNIPTNKHYNMARLTCILLVGGALGNFIDRALNSYVVDFFYFKLIDFPIFNVADIFVTFACVALIISILFIYKEDEFDQMFSVFKRKK